MSFLRLLALDPSSSAIGWAVFSGRSLEDCGVWYPRSDRLWGRIDRSIDAVAQMIDESNPGRVVIEVTSGKVIAARRSQTSIVALGQAQGAIYAAIYGRGVPVAPVTEQEWTGRKPKAERAKLVELTEPVYRKFAPRDSGLDAADAVGVGLWWLGQRQVEHALKNAKIGGIDGQSL